MTATTSLLAGALGPEVKIEALRARMAETYPFIIRFKDGISPRLETFDFTTPPQIIARIPFTNSLAVNMLVSDAFKLAKQPGLEQVWYIHPDRAAITIRTMQSLDQMSKQTDLPNLINISLGPAKRFYVKSADKAAPMQYALCKAANSGLIITIAIGNSGVKAPGFVNPWSTSPCIISVGAWNQETSTIWNGAWDGSSRGTKEAPDSWPDVVAPGVNIIGPWTTARSKPKIAKEFDENNERFRNTVPRQDWDKFTMMSGTSQATAATTGAAAQILFFLKNLIAEQNPLPGKPFFSLTAQNTHATLYDKTKPRLTGTASIRKNGTIVYEFYLDEPWKMVKQLLIDTAIPQPNYNPWIVGAGLVDRHYIRKQFGKYGEVDINLVSLKAVE